MCRKVEGKAGIVNPGPLSIQLQEQQQNTSGLPFSFRTLYIPLPTPSSLSWMDDLMATPSWGPRSWLCVGWVGSAHTGWGPAITSELSLAMKRQSVPFLHRPPQDRQMKTLDASRLTKENGAP